MTSSETSTGPAAQGAEGEPDATGHSHESACLNCGASLAGDYCHACGQRSHVHKTIGAFFHDLLHGVLHFEGKTWRTLPMLAWRPGELTRRYIEGERAKFVSPMALFLFSVFLMFAVFNSVGGPFMMADRSLSSPEELQRLDREAAERAALEQRLQQQRGQLQAAGRATSEVDQQLEEVRQERQAIAAGRRLAGGAPPKGDGAVEYDLSDMKADTGSEFLNHAIEKWSKNPSLMLYKLQSNAYKFSWVLIPLSVPFLALLFLWRRRKQRLYDHTVFVTYSIAFVTLLLIALSFARVAGLPEDFVLLAIVLIVPVHMFRQLKGAYGLGIFGALWRTVALAVFSVLTFLLFLALLFALGAF